MIALLFFFVAPIAWMVIASFQTEGALKSMPPNLSLEPWTEGYARLIAAKNWQGSFVVSLLTAVFTTFFVIVSRRLPPTRWRASSCPGSGRSSRC